MKRFTLIPVLSLAATPLAAQTFDVAAAVDPEILENARGKFLLPNGVEVAMTVQTDTSVDGQLLLRSVFALDNGPPKLTVYSHGEMAEAQSSEVTTTAVDRAQSQPTNVWVNFDRDSGVSVVERDYRPTMANLSVTADAQKPIGEAPDGAPPLALNLNGGSVPTSNGTVSLDKLAGGYKVSLTRPDLEINHVFGQALGSVLLNTANDRTIDTATTINLDLANATPAMVGSAMPRVEGLALDAARDLVR